MKGSRCSWRDDVADVYPSAGLMNCCSKLSAGEFKGVQRDDSSVSVRCSSSGSWMLR